MFCENIFDMFFIHIIEENILKMQFENIVTLFIEQYYENKCI